MNSPSSPSPTVPRYAPAPKSACAPYFSLLLALFLGGSALAQTAPTPRPHDNAPKPIPREPHAVAPPAEIAGPVDAFFKGLEQSEVRKAYSAFLTGSHLVNHEDDLDTFVQKTQQAFSVYGKMTDYELYDTREIGSRLLVATYLSYQAVAPLRWRFIFYKAEKTWVLHNMVFDDSMQDLLE